MHGGVMNLPADGSGAPDVVLEFPPPPPQAVNASAAASAAGRILWNFMINLRATEL